MTKTDQILLAWLSDAQEPGDRRRLQDRLRRSPILRARLAELRAAVSASTETGDPRESLEDEPPWVLPPPGRARSRPAQWAQTLELRVLSTMGSSAVRPGDMVELLLSEPVDAEDLVVLLLRREADGARLISPLEPEDLLPVAALDRTPSGERALMISTADDPGVQRWAIALVPRTLWPDWSREGEARWEAARQAILRGEVQVHSFEIEVGGS